MITAREICSGWKTPGVFIYSAKDNFSPVQRRGFVRYLKNEGFVPEDVRVVASPDETPHLPRKVRAVWTVDPSWPYAQPEFNRYTRRLGWRLVLGLTIGWSALMWFVVCR